MYLMECTLCKQQYVGNAKTHFNIRLNNHRLDFKNPSPNTGADLVGGGDTRGHVPPYFSLEKNCAQAKIQKRNVTKIYQIEPRSIKMTCLMSIAETKKTSSAFQFFHKHYWNSDSGKLITAVRASNLKRSGLWKSIATLCALRKNNSNVTKATTEGCFQKTANPELQKYKDR